MKNLINLAIMLAIISLLFSGCLTVEKKEYTFEFTGENSGRLTIRYINIMSIMDDSVDVSEADFDELITTYLYGSEIEDDYSLANIVSKRLFEESNMLCAEVIIEFSDLSSVKMHYFKEESLYTYVLCETLNSETYLSSNGSFGSAEVPVIIWPAKKEKIEFTTLITDPDESTVSLLPLYLEWEKN